MIKNSHLYLRNSSIRLKPALDLLKNSKQFVKDIENTKNILELGCGPGIVTQHICQTFPNAYVDSVDSSSEMLATAQQLNNEKPYHHRVKFYHKTIEEMINSGIDNKKYDVVFSNAALQWIVNHSKNIPMILKNLLKPGGVFAFQVPDTKLQPSHSHMETAALRSGTMTLLAGVRIPRAEYDFNYYFRLLSPYVEEIDMWSTEYIHQFEQPFPNSPPSASLATSPAFPMSCPNPNYVDPFLPLIPSSLLNHHLEQQQVQQPSSSSSSPVESLPPSTSTASSSSPPTSPVSNLTSPSSISLFHLPPHPILEFTMPTALLPILQTLDRADREAQLQHVNNTQPTTGSVPSDFRSEEELQAEEAGEIRGRIKEGPGHSPLSDSSPHLSPETLREKYLREYNRLLYDAYPFFPTNKPSSSPSSPPSSSTPTPQSSSSSSTSSLVTLFPMKRFFLVCRTHTPNNNNTSTNK